VSGYGVEEILFQGYPAIELRSPAGVTAVFTPQIGMLGCSLTHDGEELLGHRGGLARYEATGSTMGIPLLHPWANRLAGLSYTVGERAVQIDPDSPRVRTDPNGLPIHGLVNAWPHWELMETTTGIPPAARLSSRLAFNEPELLEAFPFEHELFVYVDLTDATLSITTILEASGDTAVPVAFGYHPYLQLPDVSRADWEFEIPVREKLVLDDVMIPTGATEPVDPYAGRLGETTYDDGYAGIEPGTRFAVSGGGRRIEVELTRGYPFAQVYAPESEDVICFEPMTAPTNALVSGRHLPLVAPGDRYEAEFALSVARA
jgi:aldose 1-epimerase